MKKLMLMHMKRTFTRVEFFIVLTVNMLLVTVSFFELCDRFTSFEYSALPSASYAWVGNMDVMQIQSIHVWFYLFFYVLSAAVYADSLLVDTQKGVGSFIAIRSSHRKLISSYALSAFIGGFIVVILPLLLGQLLSLMVFPVSQPSVGFQTMINEGFHLDSLETYITQNVLFTSLYYNNPYLLNCLYITYAGIIGGLTAAITFSLSLYIKPKRLILLGLPTILFMTCAFLVPKNYQIQFYMFPSASLEGLSITYFFLAPVILLFICVGLILAARITKKDYLL